MRTLGFRTVTPWSQLVMWVHGLVKLGRSVWNPGICRPYEEALALGLVEPRIAPLVARLNVAGVVTTFACCEGHAMNELPYIGLATDIEFAASLNQKLIATSPAGTRLLRHHWIVEYGLDFVLRPHMPLEFSRPALDQDFSTIGELVGEVVAERNTIK